MNLSIIIPLLNEEESLPELISWIVTTCNRENYEYEIILMDDGSKDNSWGVIKSLSKKYTQLKGIRFQQNYGKSSALNEGFSLSTGDVVITMDADLQDSPEEIPALYKKVMNEGYDIVSGWKKKRYDNALTKNIPSKLFNFMTRLLTKIPLHDFNCGLKAYKKEVIKSIEVYGELHRYIPVLAFKNGFNKISEIPVQHQVRKFGVSKFGVSRFTNGFLDLCTILFMMRFSRRPMHFFGLWGTLSFVIGVGFTTYLVILKLFINHASIITNRISLYIALTCIIIGVQLFLAGFISELLIVSQSKHTYIIKDRL